MLPYQLKEILLSFSDEDMKKIGNFLKSPYFNTNPAIEKLWQIIKKNHPNYDKNVFELENMFQKIYPGAEFKEQTIRNLYTSLSALLKKFIGLEELQAGNPKLDGFIAEGLSKRGLYTISEKFINKSISKNYAESFYDIDMFYYFFSLGTVSINNKGFLHQQRSPERLEAVRSTMESLTILFLAESFNISIEVFEIFFYYPEKREDTIVDEFFRNVDMRKFINYLESTKNEHASFIKIRYLLYYYHLYPFTETDYFELKSEILKIIRSVKKTEQLSFITVIVLLVTKKLLPVNRKFSREIFELAELFLSLNIFADNSPLKISMGLFRNFFTVGVILRQYSWTKNFVKDYAQYLTDEFRENEINYSMGILSFKQGKYEESLHYLSEFKMKDIGEKINTRFYIMMNYIEMKAYESALSVLQTIKQFYTDREIPEFYYELMEDSIKFFNEIIKAEEEGRKIEEQFYKEAHSDKRYYHKQYVLEKFELLR